MISSSTTLLTTSAPSYLFKLCKHFSKKIPATWTADHSAGTASFEWGTVIFQATDVHLRIHCKSVDDTLLNKLQTVVGQHLDLMTRREPVIVMWVRDALT